MAQDPKNGQNEKQQNDGDVPTKPENDANDEYLLDMVFVLDCTGSMASYINSARDNIVKISQELSKLSEKQSNKNDVNESNNTADTVAKPDNKSNDNNTENTQIEGQMDSSIVKEDDKKLDEKIDEKIDETIDEKTDKDKNKERINPEPKKKLSCKFAVVAYRDHPPQDDTFITEIRSFTSSSILIKQYLSTLSATGGGDGPESLQTALYDVLNNLNYRKNSQKIIIVITDAPPHGLEDTSSCSDGFPNGDPFPKYKLEKKKDNNYNNKNKNKYLGVKTRSKESGTYDNILKKTMPDILEICRNITDNLQASFYTVACEPCLSTSYDYGRDLMEAMAEMSNGKYLPLANANLLPKVIIGSVKQQMLIDELTEQIDKEIDELKEEYKLNNKENELTEDIIAQFMEKKWENANLTYKEVCVCVTLRVCACVSRVHCCLACNCARVYM